MITYTIIKFSPLGSTFLVRRFDRDHEKRIHFASAIPLSGKTDGASAAGRFGVSEKDASAMTAEMCAIVRENWRRLAEDYGISRKQMEDMKPAFSVCYEGAK